MAAANSASQAALAKYQAQVDVSQVNLNNASAENQSAQAGLANANTALTRQQVAYNAQMQPLQLQAEKMVTDNIDLQKAQMNHLSDEINGYNKQLDKYNSSSGLALLGGNVLRSMFDWTGLKGKIANDQSQITSLGGNVSTEGASLGTFK
jgi:cysteinyl-tRNA synthetase